MSEWIEQLREFVSVRDPRFECRDSGWPEPGPRRWIARLEHELAGPASEAELALLREGFGDPLPRDFLEFYALHDGVFLYRDTIENRSGFRACGIYVAPVAEWSALGAEAQEWIDSLDPSERRELVPSWTDDAVAFGEVPNSGNYFLVVVSGPKRGQIVYFDHDGFEFEDYASSLSEFFRKVTTAPAQVLYELGCYARYSDGATDTQWIPEAYFAGD